VPTQRALAQVFLVSQAALAAISVVVLAMRHSVYALPVALAIPAYGWCSWLLRQAQTSRATPAEEIEPGRHRAQADRARAMSEGAGSGKMEQQLHHQQRLESVGRLAGGVAHDFNNLLTVIGASSAMAERAVARGESPAADLYEVNVAVARASELTKQLLAFARRQVLVKRPVELNELVSNVERLMRRLMGDGTELSAELCSQPLRVQADAGQLEQVIVNLVLNARDAITGLGRIRITTERVALLPDETDIEQLVSGDYACIEVRDTGAGMSEEVQRRLFEPFFTTKPTGPGTGLGLATSFGIVHQHDGAIRVESAPGKGTAMRILLPLALSVEAPLATSGVLPVVDRTRVLVVEDEPQVRAIAARVLTNAGFDVQQAPNGAAGLALIRAQTKPFDVVVTDVVMPELNGPDMARAALELQPSLGLVFMSGFPEAMCGRGPDEFAGAAFLSKPFAPQQLVDVVREHVDEQQRKRAAEA
jgi:two-component system cell cycle sensor histidine kinase/response regulator CckA